MKSDVSHPAGAGKIPWWQTRLTVPVRAGLAAVALAGIAIALTAAGFSHREDLASVSNSTDGNIAKLTAAILEHSQFAHHPLDAELGAQFFDRYLDALDGRHSLFLQSDLQDLAGYRANLGEMTRKEGDTQPAYLIFHRYLERLGQQVGYMTNLLHTAAFDFNGHDVFIPDRSAAPRPRNLAAAQALWREQVRYEYLQEKLNGKSPADIVAALTRRYTRLLQTMKKYSDQEVLGIYLDSLAHVYDPHSDYLGHEEMDSFSILMNLSLSGIGATLQSDDGYCRVVSMVPGGPAARSHQIHPNDRIVAVAQQGQPPVDLVDLPLPQAVQLIRGPKGSAVTLTLIPANAPDNSLRKTVTLMRDEVRLEDEHAKARVIDLPTANHRTVRLGVIDLPSFYGEFTGKNSDNNPSATRDVAVLLRKLKQVGVQGVVLDLRQNGGGSLTEAISLTGLFLRNGPVVQTRDPSGRIQVDDDPDSGVVYDGPLVVLTSRFTASASEILAGALKDYGRALIVGDSSTFGKGTVQSLIPLEPMMDRNGLAHAYDPGALKVTISKFYRPDGASTQLKGVKADIVLPSPTDDAKLSESAMKNPLPWDRVPAAPHRELDRVQPYLATLRERSAARVAQSEDFACLKQEIADAHHNEMEQQISLNEASRRAEQAKLKAEQAGWEKKLSALNTPAPQAYEITVATASQPGLPPPLLKPANAAKPTLATLLGDPDLTEAEHILADYIGLTGSPTVLTQASNTTRSSRVGQVN